MLFPGISFAPSVITVSSEESTLLQEVNMLPGAVIPILKIQVNAPCFTFEMMILNALLPQ